MYKACIKARSKMKQFIITKKIAKHGDQAVIVIPRFLQGELSPQTIVKLTIDVLQEIKTEKSKEEKNESKK
jgi:hypothetical protein